MIDDNLVINKLIDILNSQNRNLLIGNITSPRPGSICQVSTKSGIVSAYNLNCTYPGDACVVWDKDEKRYYAFTVNPSTVLDSKQYSFRKNREIIKSISKDNYVKILYKSTIGTTIRLYVGGCYKEPKLLFSYETTSNTLVIDESITATGKGENEWIVAFKEYSTKSISNPTILQPNGYFDVFEGSSEFKYRSPHTTLFINTTNRGRGYFEDNSLDFIFPGINEDTLSPGVININELTITAQINYTSLGNYTSTITRNQPTFLFYKNRIASGNYSGVCNMSGGIPIAGRLGKLGVSGGLIQGEGIIPTINPEINKTITAILPGSYGTIDGIPNNSNIYRTLLVGNKDQYIYEYVFNSNNSLKKYAVTSNYGELVITLPFTMDYYPPFGQENYNKHINWNNNTFTRCPLKTSSAYFGIGIKTLEVDVYSLQSDGSCVTKPKIQANYYAIPKADNENITVINASYYLD